MTNMKTERTQIVYKTAFGTITLFKDPAKGPDENKALDVDDEPHASVTAPLEPIPQPESFHNEFYEVKRSDIAGFGAFAVMKETFLLEVCLSGVL